MGKLTVISLGCAKNLVDTERAVASLLSSGLEMGEGPEGADVILINTCSFIGPARQEAEEVFAEIDNTAKPGAKVIVAGCYPQMIGERIFELFPRADGVIGTGHYARAAEAVTAIERGERPVWTGDAGVGLSDNYDRTLLTAPHFAYLKVADGCDHKCTFCVIPQLRGPYRSRRIADVAEEAKTLADMGIVEINLLAQDTTNYGQDLPDKPTLADLLGELEGCGAEWIRINYMHPGHLGNDLVDYIASSKVVLPYFDIPLQHASPRMLKAMGRTANEPEAVVEQLAQIRDAIPDATLRTTFITGFPDESEDDFARLVELVEEVRFDNVGVFEYSDENDTAAHRLPGKQPLEVAQERAEFLMGVQSAIVAEKNRERKGNREHFIADAVMDGVVVGRIRGQATEIDPLTYVYDYPDDVEPGDIFEVEITSSHGYELIAEYRGDDG
ncbi:MAG: 30S ribosomal protein S12 methylthiotransferase RimO [bacterium]|nr:30S ribosomal protein S12 methylthiotransferase RimO [bacterium]